MHVEYINKVINFVLRRLGREVSFNDLPKRKNIITICEIEYARLPKAIYLPAHLSRFLKANEHFTMEGEYKRLFADETDHIPTLVIPFGKTRINKHRALNHQLESFPRKHLGTTKHLEMNNKERLNSALLIDSDFTEQYFGHWLRDELSSAMIDFQQAPSIAVHNASFGHAKGYLDLLKPNIHYGFTGVVDNLHLLVDFSQNSHKTSRYEALRNRLISKNFTSTTHKGVYIARGVSGAKRCLTNEDALIEHLSNLGFDIVSPEKLQPIEIVGRLWNAPMVIAVEGSAIAHTMYTIAKHAGVLVLQPPKRICHSYKGILDAKNNPYGFYVCQPSESEEDSFYIDSFSDLDKLIDQLREESVKRAQALI